MKEDRQISLTVVSFTLNENKFFSFLQLVRVILRGMKKPQDAVKVLLGRIGDVKRVH